MSSISEYRKKPIKDHDIPARKKYIDELKKASGDKMKKGVKVLVNLRGKNIEATILEDLKPSNTSVKINLDGKEMRKDLATIYGVEGEESAPKVVGGVPEGGVMAQKIKEKLEQKKKAAAQKEKDDSVKLVADIVRKQRLKNQLLKNKKPAGGKVSKSEFDKARADLKKKISSKPKTSTIATQTGPARPPRGTTTSTGSGSAPKPLPRDAPARPPRGRTNPPANRSKPTPLPRDAPVKKLPASYFGPKVGSRPPKKMSAQHKAKISAGVKKYHQGCIKKGAPVKELKSEINKLKGMLAKK